MTEIAIQASFEPFREDDQGVHDGDGSEHSKRLSFPVNPKKSNFKMKRSYGVLLDAHETFAPFHDQCLQKTWISWFGERLPDGLQDLMQACMFVMGAIPTAQGVWFDHGDYTSWKIETSMIDPTVDLDTGCEKQNVLRKVIKRDSTVAGRCLSDIMADQFQKVYLPQRQEEGRGWRRIGPLMLAKGKVGSVRACILSLRTLVEFIQSDSDKKQQTVEQLCRGMNSVENTIRVVGVHLGYSVVAAVSEFLNEGCAAFVRDVLQDSKRNQVESIESIASINVFPYKRGVQLSKHILSSRYICNAGAAYAKCFFSKETLSDTAKVFGIHASLENYNGIGGLKHRDFVLSEMRNEYPLLRTMFKKLQGKPFEQKVDLINLLRQRYKDAGLTRPGWRLMKRISPLDISKLVDKRDAWVLSYNLASTKQNKGVQCIAFGFLSDLGKFYCDKPRAGILPALFLVYKANFNRREAMEDSYDPDPDLHFFRAFARHILHSTDSVRNLINLCNDARDVLSNLQFLHIRALIGPRKITESRALRIIHIGHQEMQLTRLSVAGPNVFLSWAPTLPEYASKVMVFKELCDSTSLDKEGEEMSHCIAAYAISSAGGKTRIFSGTLHGSTSRSDRISIAFRCIDEFNWRVAQVRGFANRGATKQERAQVNSLLRVFNNAWRERTKENQ